MKTAKQGAQILGFAPASMRHYALKYGVGIKRGRGKKLQRYGN